MRYWRLIVSYLFPSRRSSPIHATSSLLSIGTLSLITALVLIFFSIFFSLEERWTRKLSLTIGPTLILPTQQYYDSYFFQIGSIAHKTAYRHLPLFESYSGWKDPWDCDDDSEPDPQWSHPHKDLLQPLQKIYGNRLYPFATALADVRITTQKHWEIAQAGYVRYLQAPNPFYDELIHVTEEDIQQWALLHPHTFKQWQPLLANHISLHGSHTIYQLTNNGWQKDGKNITPKQICLANPKQKITTLPWSKLLTQGKRGIIAPVRMQREGVGLGDAVTLKLNTMSIDDQEELISATVIGFYDPGIFPLGGRLFFTDKKTLSFAYQPHFRDNGLLQEGFYLFEKNCKQVPSPWQQQSFQNIEHVRGLVQQLRTEKAALSLVAFILMLVASVTMYAFLSLITVERREDFLLMQTFGASVQQIRHILRLLCYTILCTSLAIGIFLAKSFMLFLPSMLTWLQYMQGSPLIDTTLHADVWQLFLPWKESLVMGCCMLILTESVLLQPLRTIRHAMSRHAKH